jgi:DNA-binding NarL/FixJ family response regulator
MALVPVTQAFSPFVVHLYGGTSAEAFDAIAQSVPDILISDIGMPEEDGYSLLALPYPTFPINRYNCDILDHSQ